MRKAIHPFISLIVILLSASLASANNNNSVAVTSTTSIQKPKQKGNSWSGFVNISQSRSMIDFQDGTRYDGRSLAARLNYKLNDKFNVRADGNYSQDLNYPERNDFGNLGLNLSRTPWNEGSTFLLGYRVGLSLPTSKDASVRQSLLTSASGALNISINPARLAPGLGVASSISFGRNFHKFDTALDGRVNTQYSSVQTLSISYSFLSGISLSAENVHRNTWSYQNVMRDAFELSQEISYTFNPNWIGALGHSNSGNTLRANGTDSNIQITDENSSIIYASFTALF